MGRDDKLVKVGQLKMSLRKVKDEVASRPPAYYTSELLATNWNANAPYTQTASIPGVLETDQPSVDVVLSGTAGTDRTRLREWVKVSRVTTADGSITAYCLEEKPAVDLPIKIEVIEGGGGGGTGTQGPPGAAAGFGTPTASVDANIGTPEVTITASGPDTAKVFDFAFKNLKGEKGEPGEAGVSPTATTANLTAAGWTGSSASYSQEVNVDGVTANNNIIASPAPDSFNGWVDAKVYCSAQAAGKLTFKCTTKPSAGLTANILIVG